MSPHFLAHYPIKVFDPTSPYDISHRFLKKNLQFPIILLILKGYRVERHGLGEYAYDIKILRIIPPPIPDHQSRDYLPPTTTTAANPD